jgi:hypothetical protein
VVFLTLFDLRHLQSLISKIISKELGNPSTEQEIMIAYLGLIIVFIIYVILG